MAAVNDAAADIHVQGFMRHTLEGLKQRSRHSAVWLEEWRKGATEETPW